MPANATGMSAFPERIRNGSIITCHREARSRDVALPELEQTSCGHTEFRIEDPDGNRLWIDQAPTG